MNARFDDDDIKKFMKNLSDDKLAHFAEMWDHSTTNAKYKVEQIMIEEPNLKNVDEVSEVVTVFCDQFKERFRSSFTYAKIGTELEYQIRKRAEPDVDMWGIVFIFH